MKLVWLMGSQAVGKMTVGQELMKITSLRLFHNHMTIEPVLEIFGTWNGNAISRMRDVVFEEFLNTDAYGLMFTYVCAFNMQEDLDYVERVSALFRSRGAEVYYVELYANQTVRLERNETENRLLHKASKRDIAVSRMRIIAGEEKYRCESLPGEVMWENHLKLDTTCLSAQETARRIKEYFSFE
ncbi:MAG: AAA family ATPase [Clostridia bacterium]|nr:AAA family ATPase [Clostridia bacterium]